MAGDVRATVVSEQIASSDSGTADFTKSGFGTPKACIVLLSFDTSDDTSVAAESRMSIGLSDFTDNDCILHQDEDASAKVDCDARKSNTACYQVIDASAARITTGTASTITDGVRLTNGINTGGNTPFATVIMFGGADLNISLVRTTIASAQNGTATIAHSGFTDGNDKLIFFICSDISGEDSASTGINNSFGVCHATGSDAGGWTFVQRCIGFASDHNATEGDVGAILSTDRVLDIITEGMAQDWGLEVTALDHSPAQWTVTTRDAGAGTGMEVYSLALDLDDRKAKVFSVDSPISGTTWVVTGIGFTPQYYGLGLTNLTAEDTIDSGANGGALGISSNAGSGEETCHSFYNEDAAPTTNTNNLFRSRVIDFRDDDVTTIIQDHSHLSFDSDGYTTTINAENETTARKLFGWAIEEAGAAGPFTSTGTQTLGQLQQSGVGVMQPSGTAAQILGTLAQAGMGAQTFIGSGTQALTSLLQAGVGVQIFTATGVQTLASLLQSGVGVMQPSGTGVQLLATLAQAGVGVHIVTVTSTGTQILAVLVQSGTGVMLPSGTGAQLLSSLAQAGVGIQIFTGTGAQALAALLQSGVGVQIFTSTGVQTLATLAQSGVGVLQFSGAGNQLLNALVQAGVGIEIFIATGVQSLATLAQSGVGVMQPSGAGVQTLASLLQAGIGIEIFTSTGAQVLSTLSQNGTGVMQPASTGTQLLATLAQSGVGIEIFTGSGANLLATLAQSGIGVMQPSGAGSQILQTVAQAGVSTSKLLGAGAQVLARMAQSGIAVMQPSGIAAQLLSTLAQSGVGIGTAGTAGAGASILAAIVQAGTGILVFVGTGAQILSAITQLGSAAVAFFSSSRITIVPAGSRTLAVSVGSRTFAVPAGDRTFTPADD